MDFIFAYLGQILFILLPLVMCFIMTICSLNRSLKRGTVPVSNSPVPNSNIDFEKAEKRADQLLQSILTEKEREQLSQKGFIEVGSSIFPDRVYRIPGYPSVVKVYEQDRLKEYLCVQPVKELPNSDVVLMHKLSIEGNESKYLRVANRWVLSPTESREAGRRSR
ncbi:MAG: hypothetical protein Q7S82_01605 [bacterium]|nr:hypothetical protein [bacterium]